MVVTKHCIRTLQPIKGGSTFLIIILLSNIVLKVSPVPIPATISKAAFVTDKIAETMHYGYKPPNRNGEYQYEYRTTNGISAKVAGNPFGASGVVQYISNDGIPITLIYTADEDGYHPESEYVPKTPDYILRSLEYIKKHNKIKANNK